MKKALSLILALVLCLSLCACGGGEKETTPPGTTVPETTIPETTEAPKSKIGDAVNTDSVEVVLLNVAFQEQFRDIVPKEGYSFVIVEFTVKNVGKTDFEMFTSYDGVANATFIPGYTMWLDYNDGYVFALSDIIGKNGSSYDDSCFYSPNTYLCDMKPLSEAVKFKVAICVPNEVVKNTEAPLLVKFNLLTSNGQNEVAIYSVR